MITLTITVDDVFDLIYELGKIEEDLQFENLIITGEPETIYLDNGKIEVTE